MRRDPGWVWSHATEGLCNQAVCHVEVCHAATTILPAMFNRSLWAKISKSIYSEDYLKVRQVCLRTIQLMLLPSHLLDLWKVGHISTEEATGKMG